VIHDDKTTEIILSTKAVAQKESDSSQLRIDKPSRTINLEGRTTPHQAVVSKSHWLYNLQSELKDDWTLRVLAALTILVLSLLVL